MAGRPPIPQGKCQTCQKVCWESRSDAKKVLKMHHHPKEMRVYPCPAKEGMFHLGHYLPAEPRQGARDAWLRSMRRA